MKRVSMLFFSLAFANLAMANDCGQLQVNFTNQTGTVCELRHYQMDYGQLIGGVIPARIEAGESTIPFIIEQLYSGGPKVRVDYRCGDKYITMHSHQGLCLFYAWGVAGEAQTTTNAKASYHGGSGSWWASRPGQIRWNMQ